VIETTIFHEENVFDYINEFYTVDPEWNRFLDRKTVESFIRKESWKTHDQERLLRVWSCILSYMFYLGYSDTLPGDITPDEAIVSVGWCFRNIGEFEPQDEDVNFFLTTLCNFYKHLESLNRITHNASMAFAQKKLSEQEHIPIDSQGFFTGEFEEYNERGIPDLPSKVFVNISSQMNRFLNLIEGDYLEKQYPDDYRRAKNIYASVLGDGTVLTPKESAHREDARQGFLDYFCFDYKLLNTGKPLINDLYERFSKDISGKYSYAFKQTLKELTKAKLVLFTIKKEISPGVFSVVDILRQESMVLSLPMEPKSNFKNVLFCAHFFCDDGLVVNFVRGINFTKEQLSNLMEQLRKDKKYYAVRKGGRCSWSEFIDNNQLLVRNLPILIAHDIPLNAQPEVKIEHYKPAKFPKDDFLQPVLPQIFTHDLFTPNDMKLASQIWADVQSIPVADGEEKAEDPTVLALAVSRIFVELCGVYSFRETPRGDKELIALDKDVKKVMKEIKKMLHIQKYDPRYVNEEGFLLMHIANYQVGKNG